MPRCFWCTDDPLYQAYHDQEWGTPQREPGQLFEMLLLEGFQAGLSWITVLKKRERYRQVLFGFDPQRLAQMSDEEIEERMLDPASSATASSSMLRGAMPRPGWLCRTLRSGCGRLSAVRRRSIISASAVTSRP
ncbi:DNA-3-methyladenine glycosylase 1 [compost metagenome]